jgi:hypothetical protein
MRKTTGTKRVARVPRNSGLWGILAVPMLPELVVDPRIAWVLDSHTARIPKFKTLAAQSAACFRCLAAEGNHPPHRRLGHQRLSWGASFQRGSNARLPTRVYPRSFEARRLCFGTSVKRMELWTANT